MRILIMGTGFEAIYCAYYLKTDLNADVTMVEAHDNFGGVMSGSIHDNVAIDFGCQVFDNFNVSVTKAIETLGQHKLSGLDISYAGRFGGQVSYDMSCPDLSSLGDDICDRFAEELTADMRKNEGFSDSLKGYYEGRWGETAAQYLERINEKIYGQPSEKLDQHCRIYTGLKRIKLLENEKGRALKLQSQRIDDCLAVSRDMSVPFYPEAYAYLPHTNLHPYPMGFHGYTQDARETLEESGINILMKTKFELSDTFQADRTVTLIDSENQILSKHAYDLVIWTGSVLRLEETLYQTALLKDYVKPLSMHLVYCFAKPDQISDLGFLQNFDTDKLLYRWSSIGKYSAQTTEDGYTYCCMEVPTYAKAEDHDILMDELWQEASDLNLVSGPYNKDKSLYIYAPNCFNCFQLGFSDAYKHFKQQTNQSYEHLIHAEAHAFGRVSGALELQAKINNWIQGHE